MRDIIEISPHVLAFAPNCPEPVMIRFIREAAIKFCRRSRSWREDQVYPFTARDQEINLITCNDANLFEIESVSWRQNDDDVWQRPLRPGTSDDYYHDYNRDGNPYWYTQKRPGVLWVTPYTEGAIRVIMYLIPDQRAQEIPDYLVELYAEILANGALAKILMLPGNDYTNPALAQYFEGEFNSACDRHFADNLRGQQRAPVRTRPNNF